MKSIKPGRGPSMMGGFAGILVAAGGLVWTVSAASMTGSILAVLFGLCFTALAVGQTVYHFHNATEENRYSAYDITDGAEEPDPFSQRYGRGGTLNGEPMDGGMEGGNYSGSGDGENRSGGGGSGNRFSGTDGAARFCPYCGARLDGDFVFCPKCGREVPKL